MPTVTGMRAVLLTAPYGDPSSLEVRVALPTGQRTTGLVEITLEDGSTGLGEGYLAVFAPEVFCATVDLLTPYVLGQQADPVAVAADLRVVTGYWSLQGAARHVLAAVDGALVDALGHSRGVPDPVVHCWGSSVGQAMNYHAALAGGAVRAEWPLPPYAQREALLEAPFTVDGEMLRPSQRPGLGVYLDAETERRFAFRPDSAYRCLAAFDPPTEATWPS